MQDCRLLPSPISHLALSLSLSFLLYCGGFFGVVRGRHRHRHRRTAGTCPVATCHVAARQKLVKHSIATDWTIQGVNLHRPDSLNTHTHTPTHTHTHTYYTYEAYRSENFSKKWKEVDEKKKEKQSSNNVNYTKSKQFLELIWPWQNKIEKELGKGIQRLSWNCLILDIQIICTYVCMYHKVNALSPSRSS